MVQNQPLGVKGYFMVITTQPKSKRVPRRFKNEAAALVFLAPNLLGLIIFTLIPVLAGFVLSFTNWDILSPPKWIGFENYTTLLTDDPLFWLSLKNTLIYSLLVIPLGTIVSLALALALNSGIRGASIYQAIFFFLIFPRVLPLPWFGSGFITQTSGLSMCLQAA
jgi:multiple sugar transport system permease protein